MPSGKLLYAHADHPEHAKFHHVEHLRAAAEHTHLANEYEKRKQYLHAAFHRGQAWKHKQSYEAVRRKTDPTAAMSVHKSEEMEKRSKNVRAQTRNITPAQAMERRERYAQSLGLKPVHGADDEDAFTEASFPAPAKGRTLYHGANFGVEHETAHAMMTPKGKTKAAYMRQLNDARHNPKTQEQEEAHESAHHDENVANRLENLIDRRAGVGAHRSKFRHAESQPEYASSDYDEELSRQHSRAEKLRARLKSKGFGTDELEHHGLGYSQTPPEILNDRYKGAADRVIRAFDRGRKFDQYGRPVDPKLSAVNQRAVDRAKKSEDTPGQPEVSQREREANTRRLVNVIRKFTSTRTLREPGPPDNPNNLDDKFREGLQNLLNKPVVK